MTATQTELWPCTACNGTGSVIAKHGGIGLVDGKWKTHSGPVTCWHCHGTGHTDRMEGN
jgi:hypothetical protein